VTVDERPCLLFVSPVFLFPTVTGGRIRTTNILRGLKGGRFRIVLASPATPGEVERWRDELDGVCDEYVAWPAVSARPRWARVLDLLDALPVNVVADRTRPGMGAVEKACASPGISLVVFDFVHAAVLRPPGLRLPSVCFTHNVEAEIFARHAQQAQGVWRRWMWSSQHRKMVRFEGEALRRFDGVIAVSDRDARQFREHYGVATAAAIPTGVDLDFFAWQAPRPRAPGEAPVVVFTGSMDWDANVDGVRHFLAEIWPRILQRRPDARFVVVGRNPPAKLRAAAAATRQVELTGFVDDVRPYVHAARAFVIPLLVGGGTRIKAFEAMAMGCPVVSTGVGIEGLDAKPDDHYLQRDDPSGFADAVLALLEDDTLHDGLSCRARELVAGRFGHREVARVFQDICMRAWVGHRKAA